MIHNNNCTMSYYRTEGGRTIKEPRGFAYIAFVNKHEAEMAMERLQGLVS